ncbi:MAG: ABC transporter substrate-binding protein [Sphaerochaeta sp.]|uniref:ABC transporter substrate-binding protein n=1 Tax=Sphaerochaeta sp. TaxID=1972642 RepID=UPI003D0F0B87
MKKGMVVWLLVLFAATSMLFSAGTSEKEAVSQSSSQPKTLEWWDHYLPLAPLHQEIWNAYEAKTGVKVNYTQYDPAKQNDALLLAFRSGQCPDVFSMTFPGNPEPAMYKDGWFSPMAITKDQLPKQIQTSLFEGYTMFGGKVYSFPTMNNLNHNVPLWYHTSMIKESEVPATFDAMRALAKKITQQSNGKVYGVILPIAFTSRMNDSIKDWLNAVGSPGYIDWKTGAYQFDSPQMFQVFAFLTGLKDDGSVHPSSVNLDMRAARERWAAGEAAVLFDGSWNIGVIKSNFSAIIDDVGVAEPVRADASKPYTIYRTPPKGTFFISSQSHAVQEATDILMQLTSKDYYKKLAERMDQPPLDLSVVDTANVHPTYKKVIDIFAKTMAYEPDPLLRNPAIGDVYAEMRDIHPNPAEILQGYYAGAIKDWKAELKKYNAAMTKERERAVKKVQDAGGKVSLQDWVFPNWEYGMNFTTDKY